MKKGPALSVKNKTNVLREKRIKKYSLSLFSNLCFFCKPCLFDLSCKMHFRYFLRGKICAISLAISPHICKDRKYEFYFLKRHCTYMSRIILRHYMPPFPADAEAGARKLIWSVSRLLIFVPTAFQRCWRKNILCASLPQLVKGSGDSMLRRKSS